MKEVKDERPSLLCMTIPDTACAVAYDRCPKEPTTSKLFSFFQHSVQNAPGVGVLCCPRANASSATGALTGDTGELVDHQHHHHHHRAHQERHGRSGSARRLHLHRVLRQRLQREQRDGPCRAVGPLGGLLEVSVSNHLLLAMRPTLLSIYGEMSAWCLPLLL